MSFVLLLIASAWRPRMVLRAQLIEEGYDVLAVGSWDEGELLLLKRALAEPAVVFDLDGEANSAACLRTLVRLVPPGRILVLTSSAALPAAEVRSLGVMRVLARPFSVRDVVEEVHGMVGAGRGGQDGQAPGGGLQ